MKIINVDTQVKEMSYVDAYVGSDNKNAGYICGEDLIKRVRTEEPLQFWNARHRIP